MDGMQLIVESFGVFVVIAVVGNGCLIIMFAIGFSAQLLFAIIVI